MQSTEQIALAIPIASLRPLIESVLATTGQLKGWPIGRVALQEREAAICIGVEPHVLRDARHRLKLSHSLIGRSVLYTADQLQQAMGKMTVSNPAT